ncbi:MAG: hypothetical protein PHT69_07315 [Bacteroidales bacterium]|nr:hypothetical protein [Bacteroidales bacterium]
MKIADKLPKRNYLKPEVRKIKLDNNISLWLLSEGGIPDPPWMGETEHKNDPFKTNKA